MRVKKSNFGLCFHFFNKPLSYGWMPKGGEIVAYVFSLFSRFCL